MRKPTKRADGALVEGQMERGRIVQPDVDSGTRPRGEQERRDADREETGAGRGRRRPRESLAERARNRPNARSPIARDAPLVDDEHPRHGPADEIAGDEPGGRRRERQRDGRGIGVASAPAVPRPEREPDGRQAEQRERHVAAEEARVVQKERLNGEDRRDEHRLRVVEVVPEEQRDERQCGPENGDGEPCDPF